MGLEQDFKTPEPRRSSNDPPIARYRVGDVTATVWRNPAPSGGTFKTVSLVRSYKNRQDEWVTARSLRLRDLPAAIAVLQKALMEFQFRPRDRQPPGRRDGSAGAAGEEAPAGAAPAGTG
jgi:hypothetical protein